MFTLGKVIKYLHTYKFMEFAGYVCGALLGRWTGGFLWRYDKLEAAPGEPGAAHGNAGGGKAVVIVKVMIFGKP